MPFNGSGAFNLLYNWQQDAAQGLNISSSRMQNQDQDIAGGLSICLTKDGQQTPSANLPMGGFHLTNLGNATAQGNATTVQDVQNGSVTTLTSVSGTDTITATAAPAIGAYAAGQAFDLIAVGSNLTNAVTLNINGLGAKSVVKNGSSPIEIGDFQNGQSFRVRYDGTNFQVVSPLAAPTSNLSWRNKLLNGNFSIWQLGTSFSLPSGAVSYTADQWVATSGTSGGATVSQAAMTLGAEPAGAQYMQYGVQFQQTSTGVGNPQIGQRIENVRTSAGRTVSWTFYAKCASGTLTVTPQFFQVFGTGGSPSGIVTIGTTPSTVTLTTTLQKFTVTASIPSVSGKTLGSNNNDCLQAVLSFPAGVLFTATIAQCQVEEGDVTPFEIRPMAAEMAACQRYVQPMQVGFRTYAGAANNFNVDYTFPVQMRATPSFTNGGSIVTSNAGSENVTSITSYGLRWGFQSLAAGDSYILDRVLMLTAQL
ncbi:hypothetical protein NTJ56_08825 [Burkholderia contaminans]|uniref:hypothetical protein n=1 Tax=Burkholderia contaminans TaxID=488447 RepID=UPI0021505D9B|nr:hypothetical protein [Burkholderia contaminans]UUX38890.1 hypothetical protein NTJ56_08825 [Burkholderia contaminans]